MIHLLKELSILRNLSTFLSEENFEIEIFLDSSDVIRMIKGYHTLYHDGKYKPIIFNSERFFVDNLIFSGKLDQTAKILAPHQHELMINIKGHFGLENQFASPTDLNVLITDTQTFRDKSEKKPDLANSSPSELNRLIKKYAYLGVSDFKVMMSTDAQSWKKRIFKVFDHNKPIVNLDRDNTDYSTIYNSDLFRDILKVLQKLRHGEDQKRRNINDALCLCILHNKVVKFNQAIQPRIIPLFYASEKLFHDVIDLLNLKEEFTLRIDDDNDHYILRSDEYFIVHSIFSESNILDTDNELIEHYKKVAEFRSRFLKNYESKNFTSLSRLESEIKNYKDFNFLRHVMLSYYQDDRFEELLSSMLVDKAIYNEALENILDKKIEGLSHEINRNLEDLISYQRNVLTIREGVNQFRRKMSELTQVNSLRDFGLIRFSLNNQIINYVDETLWDILEAKDYDLIVYRIADYLNRSPSSIEFTQGITLCWLLELYQVVIEHTTYKPNLSFQLILLRAASILRSGRKGSKSISQELKQLTRLAKPDHTRKKIVQIELGVSYLYFHSWRSINDPFTLKEDQPNSTIESERAITLAKKVYYFYNSIEAIERSEVDDLYRLYSLNLYIYYATECGKNNTFKQSQELIKDFLSEKSAKGVVIWHYRFTDTLARYYHRLYILERRRNKSLLNLAKDYCEQAYSTAVLKRDIQDYYGVLMNI